MARVLQNAQFHTAPIAVPMPGSWDPIAQAAYEQGRADGFAQGHAAGYDEGFAIGRHDLTAIAERVVHAAASCFEEVRVLHADLVERVIELAELYVRTVVRHVPDQSAQGVLRRIEEALAALEPGVLELQVEASLVAEMTTLFTAHESGSVVSVVAGAGLAPGEYRVRSEWAEVEGTWERYVDAAREAVGMFLAEQAT